jgi:ParB family chromosome partitioning protein
MPFEVDWAIDQIVVGVRHRKDLGDLTPLKESIQEQGLLQPITITLDGVLICGARRLAAMKELGMKHTTVFIRQDLSERLTSLMAERDENTARKPYAPSEMAALYEELKAEIAADAARRVEATQFTSAMQNPKSHGLANLATPLGAPTGDSRNQAAKMLGVGHTTMDKVGAIRAIANDPTRTSRLREQAKQVLDDIDAGKPIDPALTRIHALERIDEIEQIANNPEEPEAVQEKARTAVDLLHHLEESPLSSDDLEWQAQQSLEKVKQARRLKPKKAPVIREPKNNRRNKLPLKTFVYTWDDLAHWTDDYDPEVIGPALDQETWNQFKNTHAITGQFIEAAAQARIDAGLET